MGADQTGELADAGIAADILREAAGTPEAGEGDGAEKSQTPKRAQRKTPARVSDEAEETDETSDELDTETAAETSDQDAAAETDQTGAGDESDQPSDETTTAAEGAEGETAPAADQTSDDTPEWAKKRFGELTGQIRNLRQENESLRQQANGGNAVARPVDDVEILQIETPEQAARLRASLQDIEEYAELHSEGVEADPDKPNSPSFTKEQIAQARINARKKLRALDGREKQLDVRRQCNTAAHEIFPGFNDPDSEESRTLAYVLQQVPELRRLPNYRVIIGDSFAYAKLRMSKAQAAAAQKKGPNGQVLPGKPVVTGARKVPPATNGAPVRSNAAPAGKFALRQKARTRAMSSGSEADIASLVEANLS